MYFLDSLEKERDEKNFILNASFRDSLEKLLNKENISYNYDKDRYHLINGVDVKTHLKYSALMNSYYSFIYIFKIYEASNISYDSLNNFNAHSYGFKIYKDEKENKFIVRKRITIEINDMLLEDEVSISSYKQSEILSNLIIINEISNKFIEKGFFYD